MNTNPVYVSLEFTPNPNTLKYSVNRQIFDGGAANFTKKEDAETGSPLAVELFGISGISGVMIGRDFVTITKSETGDWDLVHKSASQLIQKFVESGKPAVTSESKVQAGQDSESVKKIKDLLDKEIRPAVAMDGGDIVFDRYEEGVVYLHMMGSCSGCPSSTMTLKMGIETRLKQLMPEVREVVSV